MGVIAHTTQEVNNEIILSVSRLYELLKKDELIISIKWSTTTAGRQKNTHLKFKSMLISISFLHQIQSQMRNDEIVILAKRIRFSSLKEENYGKRASVPKRILRRSNKGKSWIRLFLRR
jgi:hypothetical protein